MSKENFEIKEIKLTKEQEEELTAEIKKERDFEYWMDEQLEEVENIGSDL